MKKMNKKKSKEKSEKSLIPMGIKWRRKSDAVQNTPPRLSKDDNDDEIDFLVYSPKVLVENNTRKKQTKQTCISNLLFKKKLISSLLLSVRLDKTYCKEI